MHITLRNGLHINPPIALSAAVCFGDSPNRVSSVLVSATACSVNCVVQCEPCCVLFPGIVHVNLVSCFVGRVVPSHG